MGGGGDPAFFLRREGGIMPSMAHIPPPPAASDGHATLAGAGGAEFVEKRSRFVGAARPVATMAAALRAVEALRAAHPDASHVAWACVAGPGGAERRAVDDGEVSGTAGAPLLSLLDRRGIRGALVAVARYYGGTKLGSGGLVRAYTRAGAEALDAAGVATMVAGTCHELACDLAAARTLLHRLRVRGATLDAVEYGERATLRYWIAGDGAALARELRDLTAGRSEPRETGRECRPVPPEKEPRPEPSP